MRAEPEKVLQYLSIDMDHHQERHMFHSFTIVSLQAKCIWRYDFVGGMVLRRKPHKEHVAKAYEIKIKEHIENKLGTYGEQKHPKKTH